MDYCKFDQVVVPNVTATSVILYLLEQISMALDKWYVVIDLVSAFFFFISIARRVKSSTHSYGRDNRIYSPSCVRENVNSLFVTQFKVSETNCTFYKTSE